MAELTDFQVDLIDAYIKENGVAQNELQEDLLDHLCTSVEGQMQQGKSFEEAFQYTINLFGPGGLKQVQTQTFELLTEMNETMKKVTFGFGLTSTFLLLAGTIFKLQHWFGANIMFTIGVAILVLGYLPMILSHKLKESGKSDAMMHILGFVGLGITSLGVHFKIMHWPGASALLVSGMSILAFGYVPVYFIKRYKTSVNKPVTLTSSLLATASIILVFALMQTKNSGWYEYGVMTVNDELMESNTKLTNLNSELVAISNWPDAQNLEAETEAMVKYLEDLKTHLIVQTKRIKGETSDKMNLHDLDIKHNSQTPTAVLLRFEGEVRTGAFSAQELEEKLNSFNTYILNQYPNELRNAMTASFGIKTDGTYIGTQGQNQTWAEHNFEFVPLFAIVSNLSKWQMEVRQMETQLLMYHGSQPATSGPPS
ncbi:MAG: hypothetical protein ACI9EQ_001976 [Bacteroidia bacterium]|jgi:hypothetical protein